MLLNLHSNWSNCPEPRITKDLLGRGGGLYPWKCLELLPGKADWLPVGFVIVLNSLWTMQPLNAWTWYGCLLPLVTTSHHGPGTGNAVRPLFCSHLLSTSLGLLAFIFSFSSQVTKWQLHLQPLPPYSSHSGKAVGLRHRTVTVKLVPFYNFFLFTKSKIHFIVVVWFCEFWQMHWIVQPLP